MKRKLIFGIALVASYYSSSATSVMDSTAREMLFYSSNKIMVDSLLNMRVPEELVRINLFYHVPNGGYEKLKKILQQRELLLICQDFIYKDSLVQRVQNKIRIESSYRDSINKILIPEIKNHISGENLSYALFHKSSLQLDSVQYNYIMEQALNMARRIREDYRVDVYNEEMQILRNTLDEQQLYSFFRYKNAKKITDEFDKMWEKLKEAGLTEQLDSINDVTDAVNYMFNRQMIKDIYRNYGNQQRKYLTELDKNMPKMMNMLNGLKKKKVINQEEKKIPVNNEFIW